ncbi:hypothetical protein I4U23_017321 [Adineta vaga]|nr:hypothetical protein I4U23_017321 [Adineta vaga]
MASNSWPSLVASLFVLFCIGLVGGTIVIALIPVYLQHWGDDIDINTNTNAQVYALSYITNSRNPTSYSINNMNALSLQLNQALNLKELVTLTAKTTECASGRKPTNGMFETEFRIDYSKVCRTQACQQNLIDKVVSHITTLFPSLHISLNLSNDTTISLSLNYCLLQSAVSTTTTQKTSTTKTANQPNTTISTTTPTIVTATTTTLTIVTATTTTPTIITATTTTPTIITSTTTTATSTSTSTTTTVPLCSNGIKDHDETDIDCGGVTCSKPCALTQFQRKIALQFAPELAKFCDLKMDKPSCSDGNTNNGETGVDCGGTQSPPCVRCPNNQGCLLDSDCFDDDCDSTNYICICFSGDEIVTLADGTNKWLKDTKVGEFILSVSYDGTQIYSTEVMMIANTQPNSTALFYTIETESGHKLSLSPDHYMRVEHFDYLTAEQLTLNHSLYIVMNDGSIQSSRIRTINQELKTGIYNLFTLDGTLLVNSIAASTYISNGFGSHHTKHRIYTPMRIGYHLSKYFGFLHKIYITNEYGLHWIVTKYIEYRRVFVFIDQIMMLLINFLSIEFITFSFGIIYISIAKKRSYSKY